MTATENNDIYSLDAVTGAVRWSRSVGAFWPASTLGCGDLVPNIGITSSPVYDPATGSVFFLAKVNDGPDAAHPHFYMHSINPATGVERTGWPVMIQGQASNNPGNTFNAETANQRPGLLLLGGVVYAGFASNCDYGPYVGYVAGVKTATPAMSTLWSTESGSASAEAGIWQSGGGLVSDGPGRIIVATGNGVSPAPGPGSSPPGTLGESVVRLQVNSDGSLTAKDFFSPNNNSKLDQDDADFGAGGPMGLPAGFGTTAHPHLMVQSGKDGRVFLLDRDNLGGMGQGPGGGDNSVGVPAGPYNGTWDHPAFWGGDGGYVYDGFLRALKYGVNGSGLPVLSSAATSSSTFGFTSGAPVVTSDGTTSGSAIVWVVYSSGSIGSGGQLRAYDALPQNGQLHLRYSASIGTANKFATPATDAGRVYIGTRDRHVIGFGRPTTTSLTSPPTDFGTLAVGSTGHATVTVTAARAVTVSAVSATGPYGVTPPALPVSLTTGQTLSVPVSFTPTATAGNTGSLVFTTDTGPVSFDLHGTGTKPGLGATPSTLAFGTVPTGAHKTVSVSITNTGTASVTITGSTPPTGPFSATGFPANGSTLAAGASVSVSVTYTPTAAGDQTGSLSMTSDAGAVNVPLTATAVTGAAHLSVIPNPLDFGPVAIGQSLTKPSPSPTPGTSPSPSPRPPRPSGCSTPPHRSPKASNCPRATTSPSPSPSPRPRPAPCPPNTRSPVTTDKAPSWKLTLCRPNEAGLLRWPLRGRRPIPPRPADLPLRRSSAATALKARGSARRTRSRSLIGSTCGSSSPNLSTESSAPTARARTTGRNPNRRIAKPPPNRGGPATVLRDLASGMCTS